MPSPRVIARDVRALGPSAPLRAAYEVSKRTGFHSVLFRRTTKTAGHRSTPLEFGHLLPSYDEARKRCLQDAEAIISEGVRVFGTRVATGVTGKWALDPLTGKSWPELPKWWEIDIRTDARLSDVKFVWEAARHRDLVVLARAAALEPDGPWFATLEQMLSRWCAECPPERGVNWYSSLELALRAIAWSQVLALTGDRFSIDLRGQIDEQLAASGRHIMLELPYTVSSMKNNHLLGDGLGLVVLGKLFPSHPSSERWQRIGDRLFHKQLTRHMRPDGSMIEDSLSYHRFVLEMLITRILIGGASAQCQEAALGASRYLVTLGALEGSIPQFGDWDEGRVLADSSPAGSVAGSALLGLALGGEGVSPELWGAHDELAWYVAPAGEATVTSTVTVDGVWSSSDFQHVRRGDWSVWFKVAGGVSHQHADVSSVWIRRGDDWIIRDPGTGTYNGPLDVRNGFRTTQAHPIWRPSGAHQLMPHRAFRWLSTVTGHASKPVQLADQTILFGWHDAFEQQAVESRVARAVIIGDSNVVVLDWVEKPGTDAWEMNVPEGAGLPPDALFGLGDDIVSGQHDPFIGWHSDTYGSWTPSKWRTVRATADAFPVWGSGVRAAVDRGAAGITVDGTTYAITWRDDVVSLTATGPSGTHELRAIRE